MVSFLPIAEGYPAVQCQFPRRWARCSPTPTQTSPANSITAHQRLARGSARVLPIAASTARGRLWMKTPSAPPHPVKRLMDTHATWQHIRNTFTVEHNSYALDTSNALLSVLWKLWLFFTCPRLVHGGSSPADTCTPPNQKARVKKKVSKSSAYRRDVQGGEWVRILRKMGSKKRFHVSNSVQFSYWTYQKKRFEKKVLFVVDPMFSAAESTSLLQRRTNCLGFFFFCYSLLCQWVNKCTAW